MQSTRAKILVVGGPTGTGKTALALALARNLHGELIGADSVQVYRDFNIGSAKPNADELGATAHHLLDVVNADEEIDAARYASLADSAIEETLARGRLPIVVGGTGLWLRALLFGLADLPMPNPEIRARLQTELVEVGSAALHTRLRKVDAAMAERLHANDAVRITRALEVFEQTGTPLSQVWREHQMGTPRYDHLLLFVDREREELRKILRERFAEMIQRGLLHEVRTLLQRYGKDVRPMQSVGYKEAAAHVLGELSENEMHERAEHSTWIYSKRQRTFFSGSMMRGPKPNLHTLALTDFVAIEEAAAEHLAAQ